jgi:hypothetical protein
MIMRIDPFVGISRMRRFRIVDMCKGKRKLWLRGTDDVLIVGLHMVGKRVKVSSLNNVTSFLALYFFSFIWFIPLISFLPLLFSFSILFLSFSYFSLSLLFYYTFSFFLYFFLSFFLSFFLFHTHTFLFIFPSLDNFSKLSTPLFLACIQTEILNKPC